MKLRITEIGYLGNHSQALALQICKAVDGLPCHSLKSLYQVTFSAGRNYGGSRLWARKGKRKRRSWGPWR